MSDDEPVTRRECATIHGAVVEKLDEIKDKLDDLNGAVADNSKFRVQQKAVYGAIAFAWATVLIPLAAIAISVLK